MCGAFKDKDISINLFEPKDNPNESEWSKEEYESVIFHELIHGIQYLIFGTTPEWINEGIAKYLDGSFDVNTILEIILNNSIPKTEEIFEEFGKYEYDSYKYAYIMVCYLIDTLGKSKFLDLLKNKEEIKRLSNNLLNDALGYYKMKYKTNRK